MTINTRTTTYAADEVSVSLAGTLVGNGTADGDFVTIETESEDFTDKVGADGEVARAKTNDRRATVKLKLLQTSLSNNFLSALRLSDINNPNGAGVGEFEVRDRSSGVLLAHSDKAWIQKPPSLVRGKEVAEYEWTIRLAHAELDFSGSQSL
jgi:hypothetical protein